MLELFGALATWRVARMLALETGPFAVFESLRNRAAQSPHAWLANGFSCVACLSFWLGLFASVLMGGDALLIVYRGLAFSAVAVILMRWAG